MVEINGLNKHFGKLHVLRDINLSFATGKMTAVVGPNASGKSTLLKTILGLTVPNGGTIRVGDTTIRKGDWEYRRRIGYMPQTPRFPENLTVNEVLALVERVRGEKPAAKQELIDHYQLTEFRDKPVGLLSAGTRQKVNAVAAMMFDVPVFICDEPTASLDPVASSRLKDWLQQACRRGKTVILSSHHIAEVAELADVIVFLLEGQVRFTGSNAEICSLTQEPTLERAIVHLMRERV
jgi:Cu-processing system ATP-binding protein